MTIMWRRRSLLLCAGALLAATGCAPGGTPRSDSGTDAASSTDAGTDAMSVPTQTKLLFLFGRTGFLQCSDLMLWRVSSSTDAATTVSADPDVSAAFIAFNERPLLSDVDGDGIADFAATPDTEPAHTAVLAAIADAQGPPAYHSALLAAREALEADMIASGPAVANTRYRLVLFTSGHEGPACTAGVDPYLFCETPRSDWASIGLDPTDTGLYYGYEDGQEYNTLGTNLTLVGDILALGPTYGAAHIAVHSVANFVQPYVEPPTCMSDALVPPEYGYAEAFLSMAAEQGGGTFVPGTSYGTVIDWTGYF